MTPTGNKVLIKVEKAEEKTSSGLYLGEATKQYPPFGEVIAIGPAVKEIKVGDRVMFERYASVILDNDERLCLESHIYGVLNG